MKKSLFLLPLLAGLALVGCGKDDKDGNSGGNSGGGGGTVVEGENFSITLSTTGYDASEYTYSLEPVEFEAGGVNWITSGVGSDGKGTFGGVTGKYNPDWYDANPNGIMQIKKETGYLENVDGVSGFSKITITWHATYSSEETKYFPTVKAGSSADSLSSVACDQTAKLNGTSLGYKDGKEGDEQRHDVYEYETTYSLKASDAFFRIMSGASASYIAEIAFAK